jgi:hypothetical protein
MKKSTPALLILCLLALTAACGGSNETQVKADANWSGGVPLSIESATTLADLIGSPQQFVGQTVLLEGKVTGVCKHTGCWVELTDEQGHSFIAKSADHSIAFPRDCEGRKARVQGVVITQPAPAAAQTSEAAEGEAQGEAAQGETAKAAEGESHQQAGEGEAHECPAPVYMMELKGATLL